MVLQASGTGDLVCILADGGSFHDVDPSVGGASLYRMLGDEPPGRPFSSDLALGYVIGVEAHSGGSTVVDWRCL